MNGAAAVSGRSRPARCAAVLCIAVLGLNACRGGQQLPDATVEGADAPVEDIAPDSGATSAAADSGAFPEGCEDLHERILAAPPTRAGLAAAFGPPSTVSTDTEPNRHVGSAVDSLFTVSYPGFLVEMRTPDGGRDMATQVEVEDNRYLAFPGIGIGAPAERLEEVLGPATSAGTDRVTYDCGEVEQPVTFVLRDGRVSRIEISYYVD